MNTIRTSLAVALLLLAGNNVKAQKVDDIVKKHVEAIGGADKWEKINSLKFSGEFIAIDGQKVLFTYIVSEGTAIRKEYTYANTGAMAYVVVNRKEGWAYIPQPSLKSRNEMIPPGSVQKLRYSLLAQDPLVNYKSKGSKVEFVGKEKINDKQCYKLKIAFKGDTSVYRQVMFIDTNTYLNMQTSIVTEDGENELIHYNDFKTTGEGLVLPMMFNEGAGPQYIDKIEVNAAIDPKAFKI